jgi:hypothetical protein
MASGSDVNPPGLLELPEPEPPWLLELPGLELLGASVLAAVLGMLEPPPLEQPISTTAQASASTVARSTPETSMRERVRALAASMQRRFMIDSLSSTPFLELPSGLGRSSNYRSVITIVRSLRARCARRYSERTIQACPDELTAL